VVSRRAVPDSIMPLIVTDCQSGSTVLRSITAGLVLVLRTGISLVSSSSIRSTLISMGVLGGWHWQKRESPGEHRVVDRWTTRKAIGPCAQFARQPHLAYGIGTHGLRRQTWSLSGGRAYAKSRPLWPALKMIGQE
jgi:hypothetical protein